MSDGPLRKRLDALVEELLREESDDAAALVAVLLAVVVALRQKRLARLAEVAWQFVDGHSPPPGA